MNDLVAQLEKIRASSAEMQTRQRSRNGLELHKPRVDG